MSRINSNQFNINYAGELTSIEKIKKGIFFAGGGGWSQGIKKLKEIEIRWILNHDRTALRTSAFHNKGVKVFWSDVYVQDEHEMEPVEMVQASLECDEHTGANTNPEKDASSYTMGWEFFRYLPHLNPLVISIENVPAFKKWAPLDEKNKPIKARAGEEFERWKKAIMDLGYEYKESIRNAADDGLPTRRVRFFCFFYRRGINIEFPEFTHSETGLDGKKKWLSCREHINTHDHGVSIFGREFNPNIRKHQRKPLCKNSLRRIAGGIKKQFPDVYQFLAKYHAGENPERSYSLDEPIKTIDTSNRHQLVTVDNGQFIQDHCQTDNYQNVDQPLRPQLTWQTKQLVTMEKLRFIMDHCHSDKLQSLNEPLGIQTTRQTKQLVNIDLEEPFITQYYGGSIQSNNLDEPINTIPCRDTHQLIRVEKMQFIAKYFNNWNNPELSTESLNDPLSAVLGTNKHQLITILDDFDIKARFLNKEELAGCSTFPRDYFSHPELKLSEKSAIQLIGNAVPPKWAKVLIGPNVRSILEYKLRMEAA
jgi:DNA (cytosine-5)-methyltransferase 1